MFNAISLSIMTIRIDGEGCADCGECEEDY